MWDVNWSIFLFGLLVRLSIATDDDDMFIYPTAPGPSENFIANAVWEIGSVQRVSWTTTLDAYSIALFHQHMNPAADKIATVHTLHSNGSGDQYFDWTVDTYDTSTKSLPVFFFWINPESSEGFTSHYFNVTNETSTAAATTSSKTTSATSTSISSSLKATNTPSAALTSGTIQEAPTTSVDSKPGSQTSSNSNSNYTALSVGLGVGLGVGVPLILLLGVWIGMKAIKQGRLLERGMGSSTSLANLQEHEAAQPDPGFYQEPPMYQPWEVFEAPDNRSSLKPFEASAVRSPVELAGVKYPR